VSMRVEEAAAGDVWLVVNDDGRSLGVTELGPYVDQAAVIYRVTGHEYALTEHSTLDDAIAAAQVALGEA
jgi:hypothetical protein